MAQYCAQRAITIHSTLDDRLSLARSENNLGLVLIRRGDLVDAEADLKRASVLFDESGVETGKAEVLLSLCELEVARSRPDEAERLAGEARTLAERHNEKATLAECRMWMGRIAADRGDHARVDAEFREAWGILDALGATERLSRCPVQYAEIVETRGDLAGDTQQLRLRVRHIVPGRGAATVQERSASA